MFDIESFPRAEEVNLENLASAIFENEIHTIFWAITEALRKEKNEVTVDIRCGAIIDFLKEKGYDVDIEDYSKWKGSTRSYFYKVKITW